MKIPEKQLALIDFATKFIGVHETTNNDGPWVEAFQSIISKPQHQPWCVDFVQYCVRQVDQRYATQTVLAPTESALELWNETPKVARLKLPEPGAIILWQHYDTDGKELWQGHAGIVREVLDSNYVMTIEGNTGPGPGVEREGDGVYSKRRGSSVDYGTMRTLGFLLPWAS